ncbi:DUF5017 domain-containing protein [Chitinophagaceae bacterium 26-R-25]|nr:DUF5017 domain-containing protein [Chitinophagaceae bacterium 26-R-25]
MFSYKNLFLIIIAGIFAASCNKAVLDLKPISSFSAVADSMNATKDTGYYSFAPLGSKVNFYFTGNPANIAFYSGELGHNFNYRNRTSADGISRFIFTNQLNGGTQPNSLHVMLSSDFKGVVSTYTYSGITYSTLVYDTASTLVNIGTATWTDITPANLATNATAVTDTIDLTNFTKGGKKVYIAFKYTGQSGSVQNQWTINNISLTNSLADNSVYTLANLNTNATPIVNYGASTYSPGWVGFKYGTVDWNINTSRLLVPNTKPTAVATSNEESWTLLGSIDLTKVTPDLAVSSGVTNISSYPVSYSYIYRNKETYNATFVATNATVYTGDSISKTIPIVIK